MADIGLLSTLVRCASGRCSAAAQSQPDDFRFPGKGDRRFRRPRGHYSRMIPVSRRSDAKLRSRNRQPASIMVDILPLVAGAIPGTDSPLEWRCVRVPRTDVFRLRSQVDFWSPIGSRRVPWRSCTHRDPPISDGRQPPSTDNSTHSRSSNRLKQETARSSRFPQADPFFPAGLETRTSPSPPW